MLIQYNSQNKTLTFWDTQNKTLREEFPLELGADIIQENASKFESDFLQVFDLAKSNQN